MGFEASQRSVSPALWPHVNRRHPNAVLRTATRSFLRPEALQQCADADTFDLVRGLFDPDSAVVDALLADRAPLHTQVACVSAMASLFRWRFVTRGGGDAPDAAGATDALNSLFLIWWQYLVIVVANGGCGASVVPRLIGLGIVPACAEILGMPSEICKSSASFGIEEVRRRWPSSSFRLEVAI